MNPTPIRPRAIAPEINQGRREADAVEEVGGVEGVGGIGGVEGEVTLRVRRGEDLDGVVERFIR